MDKPKDLITPIIRRRDTLVMEKETLTKEYHGRIANLDKEIAHIDSTIAAASRLMESYQCPTCHGTGLENQYDSADGVSAFPCWHCHGTGIIFEKEEYNDTENK